MTTEPHEHVWVLNEGPGSTCSVCGLKDKYARGQYRFVPIHPAIEETFEDKVVREELDRMHRFEHQFFDGIDWPQITADVHLAEAAGYELVSMAVAYDSKIERMYYVAAMKRPRTS